jgi:branched-chain amino acid transport system ATP-binding protein
MGSAAIAGRYAASSDQTQIDPSPILETAGLGVSFGGHQAVHDVSLRFSRGSLTAIVGPNGAGKTTYFNLISGQLGASAGRVLLAGVDISTMPAAVRARRGIGRAFQLTNLFPRLTVLENVRLAVQARVDGPHRNGMNLWSIWSDHRGLLDRACEILDVVAMRNQMDMQVASLPHGDQRKLEVAMLIAMEPKVYMFDEPTAGMGADEAPIILDLIRALKRDPTKSILLVEHKMDVVRELADRIVVLHNGRLVADGAPAEVINSEIVQVAYLGSAQPKSISA